MIPIKLQDYLVKEELPSLFKNYKIKNAKEELVPINIYPQYLPVKKSRDDLSHYPYLLVILIKGNDKEPTLPNTARVLFMTGVIDKSENNQGYRDAINIINKIYIHLFKTRVLNNKYEIKRPANWEVFDGEVQPFFYAAMETYWDVMKVSFTDDKIII